MQNEIEIWKSLRVEQRKLLIKTQCDLWQIKHKIPEIFKDMLRDIRDSFWCYMAKELGWPVARPVVTWNKLRNTVDFSWNHREGIVTAQFGAITVTLLLFSFTDGSETERNIHVGPPLVHDYKPAWMEIKRELSLLTTGKHVVATEEGDYETEEDDEDLIAE